MLGNIFSFYLQGIFLALIVVLTLDILWVVYRALKHLDKTATERQAILYEALIIALISTPVLSFAFMAILLMLKA